MIALEKYDITHASQATFATYAHNWIKLKCGRFLKNNASQIRMPVGRQRKEAYKYKFIEFDDPNKDYNRFLRDIREEYKD